MLGQGSLIEIFAIGLAVFPATKENANPFESQSPDDGISRLALGALLLIIISGPQTSAESHMPTGGCVARFPRPSFDESSRV
jgi:hypothetical protein